MVTLQTLASVFDTARRLVDLLEQDGFALDAAIWTLDEEGRGRLYLVPHDLTEGTLKQTIRVAQTVSKYRDELPERHDLLYSVVRPENPVVRAVKSVVASDGRVRGAFSDGTYVDEAYVFRPAA